MVVLIGHIGQFLQATRQVEIGFQNRAPEGAQFGEPSGHGLKLYGKFTEDARGAALMLRKQKPIELEPLVAEIQRCLLK